VNTKLVIRIGSKSYNDLNFIFNEVFVLKFNYFTKKLYFCTLIIEKKTM